MAVTYYLGVDGRYQKSSLASNGGQTRLLRNYYTFLAKTCRFRVAEPLFVGAGVR